MLQKIVDNFLNWEITQIVLIQNVFEPIEPYLEIISTVTTARFMHTFFFPLFLAFSVRQYINIMLVAITSHISVILLKWILAGTRPYWWVNETNLFTNLTRPHIRQSIYTCETTAGNPSGHVLFTAAILFFIIRTLFCESNWLRRKLSTTIKYLVWNVYVSILGLISLSRIYFACHFFHQCVFGICFGIGISQFLQNRRINRNLMTMRRIEAFLLGLCVLILCISIYYSHFIVSYDPHWAVKKAFNWCNDPYQIKPETTPMYSLTSEFGLLCGLILCSPHINRFNIQLNIKLSLPIVIALIGLNQYVIGQIPRWNGAIVFYCLIFATNLSFILLLLNLVTMLAKKSK